MTEAPRKDLAPAKPQPTDLVELRRRLAHLPAKKRLAAIIERSDVLRVVRSLPPQDLYATIREVGLEDSLELLELCHPRQVQLFLDLDGWKRDRLDPIAQLAWIRALLVANPDRAVQQLRGLDVELLTLLLKIHTRVYDLSAEEEPEEEPQLATTTPDRRYQIVYDPATADEAVLLTLKEAVDRLIGRDVFFVLRLCEAVRWEMPSALEEDAFRFRNGRIADMGFVPTHEALEIFAYVDPDAGASLQADKQWQPPPVEEGEPSTDLSTSVLLPWDLFEDGGTALGRALSTVDPSTSSRVAHELMMTANRLHMADAGDPGDPEALKATVRRCADTVGIAISYLARGDAAKLAAPLTAVPVLRLFQIGFSLGLRLQRDVKQRVQAEASGLAGGGLVRLDAPLREVVAGLLRPRPVFFGGLLDATRADFRPFASLGELAAAAQALSEAAFRAALVGGKKGLAVDDAQLAAWGDADPASAPSHAALVGAALARVVLHGAIDAAPLSAADLAALKKRGIDDDDADRARAALEQVARAAAPLPGAPSPDDAGQRAGAYARHVLQAMRAELAKLVEDAPDPRFVSSVYAR